MQKVFGKVTIRKCFRYLKLLELIGYGLLLKVHESLSEQVRDAYKADKPTMSLNWNTSSVLYPNLPEVTSLLLCHHLEAVLTT